MFRAACDSEGSATFTGQVTGRDRNWPAVEMASVQHPARKRVSPRATLGSGRAHWAAILKDSTSRTKATPAAPTDRKVLGGARGGAGRWEGTHASPGRTGATRRWPSDASGAASSSLPIPTRPGRPGRLPGGRRRPGKGPKVTLSAPGHPATPALGSWRSRWRRRSAQHEAQTPGCWLSRKPPSGAPKGPPFKVTSEGGLLAPHPFGTWS